MWMFFSKQQPYRNCIVMTEEANLNLNKCMDMVYPIVTKVKELSEIVGKIHNLIGQITSHEGFYKSLFLNFRNFSNTFS